MMREILRLIQQRIIMLKIYEQILEKFGNFFSKTQGFEQKGGELETMAPKKPFVKYL
jgi:hypothetical protein